MIKAIEKYLNESTYKWKLHVAFQKESRMYVVVSEFSPEGKESSLYIIYEKDGEVYTNDEVNVKEFE